ncbi:POT family proton-dependent oligopeptide transporter [Luteibacter rhizovicinus]|uniref:POT family proton-dependent oligopeptide transporter n=1 Tax=Luteibacter rhizovicinus TaxID=242606 RepID=A0A4R3YQ81_9GAMM|nr:oligopeptide:H+ symporter [Luteibacter rhizovicinus]TCV94947.1 POT family proton-dependent oligopeptide transporter [Luteibacter rhizovicinus]
MSPTEASTLPRNDELFGHPKGLYVCFFTEMWERFSFYGMKALLLLYLTKYHRYADGSGYDLIGAYGGLVYCLPVIGGVLADRWLGMRKAVVFGGLLLVAGHAGMAVEGHAAQLVNGVVVRDEASLRVFFLSLSLIIMGVGFLKPNVSTIVGKLYPKNDPRRDSGFSLFYAGINLGALFASLVCGYLGETLGWRYGFGAAGIGMLLGLAMFLWGKKYLQGHAEPPDPAKLRERVLGMPREWLIYLGAVAGLVPIAALMWAALNGAFSLGGDVSLALMLMILVLAVVLSWFVWFVTTQCTRVQRQQMIALITMIFMALIFYTLYEQTYGSWVTFTDRLLTKDIFPSLVRVREPIAWTSSAWTNLGLFFGQAPWSIVSLVLAPASFVISARFSDRHAASKAPRIVVGVVFSLMLVLLVRDLVILPQTAGSLTYLGALFLVLLAPLFTFLWGWLGKMNRDPSKPVKSAAGLLFAALSFVPLAFAAQHAGATGGLASVWWLVIAYLILEAGEMCLSPVGLSAVTELSMPKVVSLMMGTWFLATAFSEALAALFGKLAAIDIVEGQAMNVAEAAAKYEHLFWLLMWIGLGCAAVAFAAAPWLRRWMHRVER